MQFSFTDQFSFTNRFLRFQMFHAPDNGAGAAGGGNNNSAPADSDANAGKTAGDAATSSAKPNEGAGDTSAKPNGDTQNKPDDNQDKGQDKPKEFTLTEEQMTARITEAVNRAKGQWERTQRQTQQQQEADAAKAAGDVAKLEETYKGQLAEKDARIAELEGELKKRDRDVLVGKVANKHKLPPELSEVLKGETEAELEAHAQTLAKVAGAPVAPPTEAGKEKTDAPAKPAPSGDRKWSFNQEAGVSW